ncbi:hypothetical protein HYG86_14655 [Alkalicella caledoniensis]|uniref:Uncharacterized protein n=1 Tax=Alkalicella caledoniensis TaxID=2731377 RepID=A0A7G9WB58_ALKCA|nr:hypothetical protein [Alkalicella caledoniensis]QNO15920.1 hypothetical protein HYG86_14655 [Alkalicella caledoniensis]
MDTVYSTINIYNIIKNKYNDYLKPEITSITIIQSEESVWLESVEVENVGGSLEKQTVRRIDLDFIADEPEEPYFNPKDTIEENVRRFIKEFSPYSIIQTTELFRKEACDKIAMKYERFGVDR